MFRNRQKFEPSGSNAIFIESDKVLDNGVVERKKIDVGSVVLPPVENYDLGTLLKAGVPLQEVNCKLISSEVVPPLPPEEKKETVEPEIAKTKEK